MAVELAYRCEEDFPEFGLVSHTRLQREKMIKSMAASGEEEKGCKPRIDILNMRDVSGETVFLLRLREDWDSRISFHLKKYSDFEALDKDLRAAEEDRPWGQEVVLTIIPELPEKGTFGFRRQLSKLGVGDFRQKQREGLQHYLDALLSQAPTLDADPNLQDFFRSGSATMSSDQLGHEDLRETTEERKLLREMVIEVRGDTSVKTLAGFWRLNGSQRIWTLQDCGRALLDGKHRGREYDLREYGWGLDRAIMRADGWQVDIEKSSKDTLVWTLPGQADLLWTREANQEAHDHLKKVAARRAAQFQKKMLLEKWPAEEPIDGQEEL